MPKYLQALKSANLFFLPRLKPVGFQTTAVLMTAVDQCYFAIGQLEYEPELMAIAAEVLYQLVSVATIKRHIGNEPIRSALQKAADEGQLDHIFNKPILVDLPETHARQGTAECPGGLCPLD